MRVLVLSVTAGNGHNSCAQAVAEVFEERGATCKIVDTIKYINNTAGDAVNKSYLGLGKHSPGVWGRVYRTAVKTSTSVSDKLSPGVIPMLPAKFKELVINYEPDVIICTHFFASILLTKMRSKGDLLDKLIIGINTDFTLHPFWESVDQDYLVVAAKNMDFVAKKRGIPKEKLLPFGIPISSRFDIKIDKAEAREKLALDEKLTVLLMSGSMGFGNLIDQIQPIDAIDIDFQIVCICGSNKKMKESIDRESSEGNFQHKVVAVGFVDNVEYYMSAADIICTKPGGLSMSEAMSISRPIVLVDPIPGLEEINGAFLVNNGLAMLVSKDFGLDEAVYSLTTNQDRIDEMLIEQQKVSPKHSAHKLVEFVEEKLKKDKLMIE